MSAPAIISSGTASGGPPVGGSGTTNTIPRWTGPSTLGDSGFVDDGSTIAAASRMLAIGTSSTTGARVWIQNNSSGNTLVLVSPSGAGSAFGQLIEAGTNASDYALNIRQRGTANPLAYVRGDGNVGIGTASPAFKFVVADTVAGVVTSEVRNDSTNSAATTRLQLNTQGGTSWIEAVRNSAGALSFATLSNERMRISGSAAQVAIGTSSFTSGCSLTVTQSIDASQSGQGLKLQGTAGTNNTDPNVLDFYADGGTPNSGGVTWTPTLNFGGATTGITYAANGQAGRYTRVGNMVYLTMYIKLSSKGSATGNATITGLPTSANVPGLHASGAVGIIANITFANQMTAALLANSAELRLYETTNAGLVTTITDADFAANSELAISIAYPVN